MENGLNIRSIAPSDYEACQQIADDQLGKDYLQLADWEDSSRSKLGVVAIENNAVCGFLLWKPSNEVTDFETEIVYDFYLKNIAVSSEFQGKGIGDALVKAFIASVSGILTSRVWTYPGYTGLKRTLERNDFEIIETVEQPWKDICDNGTFKCPVRKESCCCDAIIMRRL